MSQYLDTGGYQLDLISVLTQFRNPPQDTPRSVQLDIAPTT